MGDTLVRQRDSLSLHRTSAEQLEKDRRRNDLRLKGIFENIFDKYTKDFSNTGDEIDLETGQIVVNNGHLAHMRHERDVGSESARRYLRPAAERTGDQAVKERSFVDQESDSDELGSGHKKHVRRNKAIRHTNGSTPLRPPQGLGSRAMPDSDASQQSDIQRGHAAGGTPSEPATTRRSATTTFTNGILGGVQSIANSMATAAQPHHDQPEAINPGAIQALGQNIANQIALFLNQHVGTTNQSVSNDPWSVPPLPATSGQHLRRPASPSLSPAPSRFRTPNPHRSLWAPNPPQPRPQSSRPHQARPHDKPPKRQRLSGSNYTPGLADESVNEQTGLLEDNDGVPDTLPYDADDNDTEYDDVPYAPASDDEDSVSDAGHDDDGNDVDAEENSTQRGRAFTEKEDALIRYLKETRRINSWSEISKWLPGRTECSVSTRYYRSIRHIPRARSPRSRFTGIRDEHDEGAHYDYGSASMADNMHPLTHAPANHSSADQARTSLKRKRNETTERQWTNFDSGQSSGLRANDRFDHERLDPRLRGDVEVRSQREADQPQQIDFAREPVMVVDSFDAPNEVVDTTEAMVGSSHVHSSPLPSVQVNNSARNSYQAQPQPREESFHNSARHMASRTPAAQAPPRVRSERPTFPIDDEESYDELSTPAPSQHSSIDASSRHYAEVSANQGRKGHWTADEDALLADLRRKGMSWRDIAPLLGRTKSSIRARGYRNPALVSTNEESYDELSTPAPSQRSSIDASGRHSAEVSTNQGRKGHFTAEEDALLADLRRKGMSWKEIAPRLGRTKSSIRARGYRNPELIATTTTPDERVQTTWTRSEDAHLYELICQGKDWEEIAHSFPGRSAQVCRRRHQSYLTRAAFGAAKPPKRKRKVMSGGPQMDWLPEEDDALVKLREDGLEFSEIARILPGRSANACSARLNTIEGNPEADEHYRSDDGVLPEDATTEHADRLQQLRPDLEGHATGRSINGAARERFDEEAVIRQLEAEEAERKQVEAEAARERRERERARQRHPRIAAREQSEVEAARNRLDVEIVEERHERDAARRQRAPQGARNQVEEAAVKRNLPEREDTQVDLGDAYRTGVAWTPEEDAALLELVRNKGRGVTWVKLAKNMPGRSGHSCKKRYQERIMRSH
ncbi:hypothetical protein MBLNU457_g0238t1 [Dothideomycetes sp. NU457]